MLDTTSPSVIAGKELRAMRQRVFDARDTTLDDEGARYALAAWRATVESLRRMTRATLTGLSERAFEAQPTAANGEGVWSAGQIVRRLAQVQMDLFCGPFLRATGGAASSSVELGVPDGDGPLTRADALATLAIADRELARFFAELPPDLDLAARAPIGYFGELSLGGLLTIVAIHEEDHWGQLNELR